MCPLYVYSCHVYANNNHNNTEAAANKKKKRSISIPILLIARGGGRKEDQVDSEVSISRMKERKYVENASTVCVREEDRLLICMSVF